MATTTAEYGSVILHHEHATAPADVSGSLTVSLINTTQTLSLQVDDDTRQVPTDRWPEVQAAAMPMSHSAEEALQAIYDTL